MPGTDRPADAAAAGAAAAVAATPQHERGSDEAEHELGGLNRSEVGGRAIAAPPARRLNWLA
jgi:hypothetical protein